jgi:hypothetical protein
MLKFGNTLLTALHPITTEYYAKWILPINEREEGFSAISEPKTAHPVNANECMHVEEWDDNEAGSAGDEYQAIGDRVIILSSASKRS